MNELEQRLVALGASLELPAAPDVVPAVLARLPDAPRRHRRTHRVLVAALAAVLLLAAGAMAVPQARHEILRLFGVRGVRIERVPSLPPLPGTTQLGLGERIPLARARHAAGFTALLPATAARAAYLGRDVPGGRISLLAARMLIIEFRGTAEPFIFKLIGPGSRLTGVRVNGGQGAYLSGAPHQVLFQTETGQVESDRVRLAGNVLIWQQGPLTIRIEGARTLAQARALARSLR